MEYVLRPWWEKDFSGCLRPMRWSFVWRPGSLCRFSLWMVGSRFLGISLNILTSVFGHLVGSPSEWSSFFLLWVSPLPLNGLIFVSWGSRFGSCLSLGGVVSPCPCWMGLVLLFSCLQLWWNLVSPLPPRWIFKINIVYYR